MAVQYDESQIQHLEYMEHIRRRPGMYIGKLGDGNSPDDGIYILLKEIVDNSIDEFTMGAGRKIEIQIDDKVAKIRDYGRGIPLGKVVECVSQENTGGKYDSEAFQKSIGLNGVGSKAVNALSSHFLVRSFRDGRMVEAEFSRGKLVREKKPSPTSERNGTYVEFEPDGDIFPNYRFHLGFVEERAWNYCFLNQGLLLAVNDKKFQSQEGLLDLLKRHVDDTIRYPVVRVSGKDIEFAFTHGNQYGEHYFSFVNGQHTTEGGTHLAAFREGLVKGVRDHFRKDYDPSDVRASVIGAISIRIQEPVFESQTKNKLGSTEVSPGGQKIRGWIVDFVAKEVDNALHRSPEVEAALKKRVEQSERERKEISGIRKLANESAKKASFNNDKLRDCRIHFDDKHERRAESTLFITEGLSASGSITKARDPRTQAVFSLRGKPKNCFGKTKKMVYENEEFNLLQHALNIEDGLDGLRYNNVVIATDADVDGMHIRLLLLTYFLQFFPELVENNHLYILQTPLFRVRTKAESRYCYSEAERDKAAEELGRKVEITRFTGLGEISPDEFEGFIGPKMRLDPVVLSPQMPIERTLKYYMGNNTPERQDFIIENLRVEVEEGAPVLSAGEGA